MAGDASDFRRALGRILAAWWKAGGHVSAEEVRKYMQPFAEKVVLFESQGMPDSDVFRTLVSDVFPDGSWQGAVALNQLFYLAEARTAENWQEMEERLKRFLEKWNKNPINLSALLVAWRVRGVEAGGHPLDILDAVEFDPSRESYFDPERSANGADFFVNILKNDYGVDVEPLLASVKEALGGKRYVGEFLRLVDIDLPMGPEEFVRRVEQAVNVVLKAREQGLDVGRIVEVWDALADGGGERLERLADAVRVVAEEEVRRRFWEEVRKILEGMNAPIVHVGRPADLFGRLYDLGIAGPEGSTEDLAAVLHAGLEIVKKIRPAVMYTLPDVVDAILVAIEGAESREDALFRLDVLSNLDHRTLRMIYGKREIVDPALSALRGAKVEEAVEALRRAFRGGIPEDVGKAVTAALHDVKEG